MNKYILLMLLCLLIGCRNQGNDVVIKDVDDVYFYLENKQNPEKAQLMARIAYELNRENYKEAEKYFLKVAKYDKTAYVSIADMYYEHIDENEGKKRYEIAFEKGNKKAGTILGMIAEDNNDYKKAEEWYKKSLDKENVLGYKSFATFLYKTNRKNEAEKYFIEAGNRKDADSMLDLIKIYYMKKDNEKLKYWQDKILNTKEIFRFDDEANDLLEYSLSKDRMDKEFFELYIKGEESILKKDYDTAEKYFLQMEKLKKEGILYTADFYYRYKDEKEKVKAQKEKQLVEDVPLWKKLLGSLQADMVITAGRLVDGSNSEMDLLIVGDKTKEDLKIISKVEKELGLELYYSFLSKVDFIYRLAAADPFLYSVLNEKHEVIVDKDNILSKTA